MNFNPNTPDVEMSDYAHEAFQKEFMKKGLPRFKKNRQYSEIEIR